MSATIDELLQSAISLHEEHAPDDVPLGVALDEAVELLRPLIDQRKIEIKLPENMPTVRGNRGKLREVFFNLLANAIKFNDKTGAQIVVTATTDDDRCTISFNDNGPGIPANELTRIFGPFRRLPGHRDVPGSGLGLYFSKSFVEQQGGRIWAESELGRGSRFHVELALAARGKT